MLRSLWNGFLWLCRMTWNFILWSYHQFETCAWPWYKAQSRRAQIIVGCVTGVVLIACCALGNAGRGATATNTDNTNSTTTNMNSSTAHRSATATPAPKSTGIAANGLYGPLATGGDDRLGGTLDAFIERYGNYTVRTPLIAGFQTHCGSGSADCVQVGLYPGTNGKYSVDLVTFSTPDSGNWTALGAAKVACQAGYPSDAHFVSERLDVQGGQVNGEYLVYTSASLGRVFPASLFTDSNGNDVTPGTFDVLILTTASGAYSDCQIAAGETGA